MDLSQSKLAFFLPDLEFGGAEGVMVSLAAGLAARGASVELLLAQARGPLLCGVPDSVRVIDLGRTSRYRPRSRYGLGVCALAGLARYLRRSPPTSLLSSLTGANLVAIAARGLGRATVPIVLREANIAENIRHRALRIAASRLYPSANRFVAVSGAVADDLVSVVGVPACKVRVIYNPIDTDEVRRRACEAPAHPWLEQSVPIVLGVGRLVPQKDFALLLRAFARLRRTRDARLILLGEGPLRATLQSLASTLGVAEHVAMPGYSENPFAYMRGATVLTLSSRWEGLPNVLIQALAVGTPVVATDCRSGPREILENGRYGKLTPVGDETALAQAIEEALSGRNPSDPERRRGRAEAFSLANVLTQYCEVLMDHNR